MAGFLLLSRRVLCVAATGVLVLAGCSSPTAPTPPPQAPPSTPPAVNTPPQVPLAIVCPASVTVASPTGAAVPVTFSAPTTTGGVAPVQVSCTRQSGSPFAIGTTAVQCTATDSATTPASAACQFAVTVTAPLPRLSRTKFLAFGDSMTAGEVTVPTSAQMHDGTPNVRFVVIPAASYPTQLLSQIRARYTGQAAALQVTNAGSPGEWAEDGAIRLPGVMSNVRPEVVMLMEGVNELSALGSAGVERAARAIDLMAKEVRLRGARLFLATLPPSRSTGVNAIPRSQTEALNALVRATARGEDAVLVDVYLALGTDINRYIGVDGLHPTEAGYQKIADTFFAAIRAELEIVPQ